MPHPGWDPRALRKRGAFTAHFFSLCGAKRAVEPSVPLPEPWVAFADEDGAEYYFNPDTGARFATTKTRMGSNACFLMMEARYIRYLTHVVLDYQTDQAP